MSAVGLTRRSEANNSRASARGKCQMLRRDPACFPQKCVLTINGTLFCLLLLSSPTPKVPLSGWAEVGSL